MVQMADQSGKHIHLKTQLSITLQPNLPQANSPALYDNATAINEPEYRLNFQAPYFLRPAAIEML